MAHIATIMLLGSGELGREFVISAKRLGARVIACDAYDNAPAMQRTDERPCITARVTAFLLERRVLAEAVRLFVGERVLLSGAWTVAFRG